MKETIIGDRFTQSILSCTPLALIFVLITCYMDLFYVSEINNIQLNSIGVGMKGGSSAKDGRTRAVREI